MALEDGMCEIPLSYWLAKIQYMLWKIGLTLNILKGSTLISDQIICTVFPAILQLGWYWKEVGKHDTTALPDQLVIR